MQKKSKEQKVYDNAFGLYIKKKRVKMGWTQADLASRIGNNAQNISSLERGEFSPTLFSVHKLADAFDLPLNVFLRGFKFSERET